MFISDANSKTPDDKFRDIIKLTASLLYSGLIRALLSLAFEVIMASEICKRFDSSHLFWDIFRTRKENKKKNVGYCEIENIDNPCILTLAVNPKSILSY